MEYKRVLVATDLTPASEKVVAESVALARRLEADLSVLYVLTEEELRDMREDFPAEEAYVDRQIARLQSEALDQIHRVGGTSSDVRVERGKAGEAVHRVAADIGSDMIVIGVRNRSRVGKLLLGSATQEILIDAPCPVLGVPI